MQQTRTQNEKHKSYEVELRKMCHAMKKIIFMGTPEVGVIVLEKLINSEIYKPGLVITQPDKPAGKRRILAASPVKILAQKHNIEIQQPEKLKDPAFIAGIMAWNPDCIIVAAYGKFIPKEILDIPRYGILNIHPSLLPRHRGPSPVQYAILEGDTTTGVSIMRIDEGMDSGPILAQKSIPMEDNETAPVLLEKLFQLGAELLLNALPKWLAGTMKVETQNNQAATVTKLLSKEDGEIKSDYSAQYMEKMVRAFSPWPGVYLKLETRNREHTTLKILKAKRAPCEKKLPPLALSLTAHKALCLHAKDGCLILETVHPAGKKPMSGYAFFLGNH